MAMVDDCAFSVNVFDAVVTSQQIPGLRRVHVPEPMLTADVDVPVEVVKFPTVTL
jgi:hypothetical protein